MSERPILFSAPMVRALMSGTKTQTRRIVKGQEYWGTSASGARSIENGLWRFEGAERINEKLHGNPVTFVDVRCPYGQPGDRLWVRETCDMRAMDTNHRDYAYRATCRSPLGKFGDKWTPSIHMPRWASRITLEITCVRVELLQDISEADAIAEGAEPYRLPAHPDREKLRHVDGYSRLWDQINGPGSWEANPWVWCIEFRRVES